MSRKQKGYKFKVGDFVQSSKYIYYIMEVGAKEHPTSHGLVSVYVVKNLITRTKMSILTTSAERTLKSFTPSPAMVALYCDKETP